MRVKKESYRQIVAMAILVALFLNPLVLALPEQEVRQNNKQSDEVESADTQKPTPTIAEVQENLAQSPVRFEINRGQFDRRVRFQTRGAAGYTLFLTADEAVYVMPLDECRLRQSEDNSKCQSEPLVDSVDRIGIRQMPTDRKQKMFALRMKLEGANRESEFVGENELAGRTNYLKGADESRWQTEVPSYAVVRYREVYQGIDLVWKNVENERGATRYDFEVLPGADVRQIRWRISGAESLELDSEGNLLIKTAAGVLRQAKPFSYQEGADGVRYEVESGFELEGNRVSFRVGEYDRTRKLTIDPTVNLSNLAYSTFLGGSARDEATGIAVDAVGNVYVTGYTSSTDYPTTSGAYDQSHNGGNFDVFVTKLNAAGSSLIYSTFIGGSGSDVCNGIAIDSSGNAFVTGQTAASSVNFPTTTGAYDQSHNGNFDVFVTKLNATGSGLVYSTFIGGNGDDNGEAIAIDSAGNAFVTGQTAASTVNFPTTSGAFDVSHNGSFDAFVTKLDAAGSALVYSTFLGGSGGDAGSAIAIDLTGNAFVIGRTSLDTTNFPTTIGAFDASHNGNFDVFVTKLNAAGSSLIYSTFIGGSSSEFGEAIAIDSAGNAFVTGYTSSTTYPTTTGAFDVSHNGGFDAFVTKLNAAGSALVYSTFLGGSSSDIGYAMAIDSTGNAFVTGETLQDTTNFPTTTGAFDTSHNGNLDVFVTKLNAAGSGLVYSTFIGGSGDDSSNGIAIDSTGNVFVTGGTASVNYPVSNQAFQGNYGGGTFDAFVTKLGNFVITGKTIDSTTGNPLPNVMIAMSGVTSDNMLTNADGRFTFTNTVTGAAYSVSATRSGYYINPSVFNIASLDNNRELIFVGQVGSPTGGSGGTLRVESLTYGRREDNPTATVTIRRSGTISTPDPITVDYQTVNGTAQAGTDYVAQSGILTFNFWETTKTITIPLINDNVLEAQESFYVMLSNPTNNADIEPGFDKATVVINDEDLSVGNLIISEFRERGKQGAKDEYVEIYNPTDVDITVTAPDNSNGLTLVARGANGELVGKALISNGTLIRSHGYLLLTNQAENGYSLARYPSGDGVNTAVGDYSWTEDIADNTDLALVATSNLSNLSPNQVLDAVGFDRNQGGWAEGKGLPAIEAGNDEFVFVRRIVNGVVQDTNNNSADFVLVSETGRMFAGAGGNVPSVLGVPAPQNRFSLLTTENPQIQITELMTVNGTEEYDPTPVPNGRLGTLTLYRKITNTGTTPVLRLRFRVTDITSGSSLMIGRNGRADVRVLSSYDTTVETFGDPEVIVRGLSVEEGPRQSAGGGWNSSLVINAITPETPLMPGQTVYVSFRLGIQRWGKYRFKVHPEVVR